MMRTITVRIHVHLDGDADAPPLAEVLLDVARRLKIPRNAVAYCLGTPGHHHQGISGPPRRSTCCSPRASTSWRAPSTTERKPQ